MFIGIKRDIIPSPALDMRRAAVSGSQMVFSASQCLQEYVELQRPLLDDHKNEDDHESIADLLQLSTLHLCIFVIRELKLRNYTPEDEELKQRRVPNAKPTSGKLVLKG